MGLLSNLRDKYITLPVAKRLLTQLQPIEKKDVGSVPSSWAVPMGFNNSMSTGNKRQTSSAVDFGMLRALSINHETTRAAINTRKRQITQLDFDVVNVDSTIDPETTAKERAAVKEQLTALGGTGVRFRELLDLLIEDTLVLDALCFYKQRTRGGKLLRIIPVDASTIKLRVGLAGERPLAPEIAFEQWIRGKKVAELTTEEMVYERMNPRTDSPYGLSPIETLIITIEASMRATLYNLHYLSDSNVPQGFLNVPDTWTTQQIKEYYEFLNAAISSPKDQAKIFPIPSGATYQATSKPSDFSFQEFFDYLDRKVCTLFDVQPQELGLQLKQYKENAGQQDKIQIRKGIKPLAYFVEEVFTDIINDDLGYPQYRAKFLGLDGKYDPETVKTLVPLGVLGVDEARADLGLPKLNVKPFIVTGAGVIPVDQIEATHQQSLDTQANQIKVSQQLADQKPQDKPQPKEKIQKKGRNLSFEEVEKAAMFRKFKASVRKAINKQIHTVATEEAVARITQTQKADSMEMTQRLDGELPTIYIEGLETFLEWAAEEGGQDAYEKLNIEGSFKITNPKFKEYLASRQNYLIQSLDETTRDWLIEQIVEGKKLSLTNAEIASQIADDADEISLTRANTIVNTEVANAMQLAELDTYKEQGIEEKMWVTSEDELVCPICEPLDNEVVKTDAIFSSGDDAAPAHPNCRCYIQAVIAKMA